MERERAKEEVAKRGFSFSEPVKLGVLPKYKRLKNGATSVIAGEGTLTLSAAGLSFEGTRYEKPFMFSLSTAAVPTFGMCTDISRFYTFYRSEFFEFYPERNDTMRWFHLTEELHRLCGGRWRCAGKLKR